MAAPAADLIPSLLLQSKTALQRGQALCTRANDLSIVSASLAVDALALDAKVRCMTEGMVEQLKMAGEMIKALVAKRNKQQEDIRRWDILRDETTEALDSQLDRLAHTLVPPSVHAVRFLPGEEGAGAVDPFEEGEEGALGEGSGSLGGSGQRQGSRRGSQTKRDRERDKSKWKNLRDFVDEREVDELMEMMEQDRTVLDEVLRSPDIPTPHVLTSSITHLRSSLPAPSRSPPLVSSIHALLGQQEDITSTMSIQLESLTTHYEQMTHAAQDVADGVPLEREDLELLARDTQEVGPILEELEQAVGSMEGIQEQLRGAARPGREALPVLENVWGGLDALRMSMTDLAGHIALIEETAAAVLPVLSAHLAGVNSLQGHFREVELAYHALVVELDRRAAARARAEAVIREMQGRLEAWRLEETRARDHFLSDAAEWLPEHVCPSMGDPPEQWEVRRAGLDADVELEQDIVLASRRELAR